MYESVNTIMGPMIILNKYHPFELVGIFPQILNMLQELSQKFSIVFSVCRITYYIEQSTKIFEITDGSDNSFRTASISSNDIPYGF